jgi:hypothetical protein
MRVGRYMDITPERGTSSHEATDATNQVKNPEDLSVEEVRQGVTGHGVRYVLGISLAAALIGLGLAWVLVV